jgi:hypothetical protein
VCRAPRRRTSAFMIGVTATAGAVIYCCLAAI